MPSVAVIDIGSNSIKILVAASAPGGGLTLLKTRTIDARISAGISRTNPLLAETGMAAGLDAIRTLLADAAPFTPARTLLVATSAVRDAQNGPEFRTRVQAATVDQILRQLGGRSRSRWRGGGASARATTLHLWWSRRRRLIGRRYTPSSVSSYSDVPHRGLTRRA